MRPWMLGPLLLVCSLPACGDDADGGDGGAADAAVLDGGTDAGPCTAGARGCPCSKGGACDGELLCTAGTCGDTSGDGDGDGDAPGDGDGDGDAPGDGDGDGDGGPTSDPNCDNAAGMGDGSSCSADLLCIPVGADSLCTCPSSMRPPQCTAGGRECGAYPGTVCSELPRFTGYYCMVLCTASSGMMMMDEPCPMELDCVATSVLPELVCAADSVSPPSCSVQSDCFAGSICTNTQLGKACVKECAP